MTNLPPRSRETLYRGCLLASIVHAIMVALYPEQANEQSWDESNYSVQDSAGSRGTIAFADGLLVAVFQSQQSVRYAASIHDVRMVDRLFDRAPADIRELAKREALQYVLDRVNGDIRPVVTAVFWAIGDQFDAAEPWDVVDVNGAWLVKLQCQKPDLIMSELRAYYNMSDEQVALADRLFQGKLASPSSTLVLAETDQKIIEETADGPNGLAEARTSLAELQIVFDANS